MTTLDVSGTIPSERAHERSAPLTGARVVELDGLRGFAALAVIAAHYFGEVPGGLRALTMGWLAVSVFFVLSGFLIGTIILENRRAPNFFTVFYVRRTCRIMPAYLMAVGATFMIVAILGPGRPWVDPLLPLSSYLTFTQNVYMALHQEAGNAWLRPTWTLTVEEQFYLLAPLVIVLTPARYLFRVLVAGMISAVLFRAAFVATNELAALVLLPSRWDLLFAGVLAALLAREGRLDGPAMALTLRIVPLVCAAALLPVLLLDPNQESGWFAVLNPLVIGIGAAAFIVSITQGAPEGKRFRSRLLRFFGVVSYGLYISHQPVAGLLHGLILGGRPGVETLPEISVTFLAFFVSVALAVASWRFVERPILRFGYRWRYQEA